MNAALETKITRQSVPSGSHALISRPPPYPGDAGDAPEEHENRKLLFQYIGQLHSDVEELKQQDAPPLAESLSTWLAALFVVAAKNAADRAEGACVDLKTLGALAAGVGALRRADQFAEWLKLGRERFELERAKNRRNQVGLFLKWNEEEKVREAAASNWSNAEKIEALGRSMFGDLWDDDIQTETPAGPGSANTYQSHA